MHHDRPISLEVSALIDEIDNSWKRFNPVAASLWGEPILDYTSSFSNSAIQEWRIKLGSMLEAIHKLKRSTQNLLEIEVLKECKRFIYEQLYLDYEGNFTLYLQNLTYALYPFLAARQSVSRRSYLHDRFYKCSEWFRCAKTKINNGTMFVKPNDLDWVRFLKRSIIETWADDLGAAKPLLEQLDEILQCPSTVLSSGHDKKTVSAKDLFENVFGEEYEAEKLFEIMREQFTKSVQQLSNYTNLQSSNGKSLYSESSPSDLCYLLSKQLESKKILSANMDFDVVNCPKLLQPITNIALFLRNGFAHNNLPTKQLILHENIYKNRKGFFLNSHFELALILMHEAVGHNEQLKRSSQNSYAKVFNFTRSHIGFEGWAAWAESFLEHITERHSCALEAIYFHRVRRFGMAMQTLIKAEPTLIKYQGIQRSYLRSFSSKKSCLLIDNIERPSGWSPFIYSLGYLHTKEAIEKISESLFGGDSCQSLYEYYLSWGPLHPRAIAKMALSELKPDLSFGTPPCFPPQL